MAGRLGFRGRRRLGGDPPLNWRLPVTRNYVAALVLVVVLALAGGMYAFQSHANTVTHRNAVEGCDRGNVIRQTLHDFLHEAAQSRQTLANLSSGKVRRENLSAARRYGTLYRKFHAIDCEKAYPKP